MSELKSPGKSFEISKAEVWQAWEKVKANKGAPGVDGCSIEEFEADLKNNLYKVWNRMSSGSYFPPPVRAVEIPKSHGGGTRILGVPTVADRVAQTVVARRLETRVEEIFHPDSYGYRPGRARAGRGGGLPAALLEHRLGDRFGHPEVLRQRPEGPVIKAVEANTDLPWVVLYVKRWLDAPVQNPDGSCAEARPGYPARVSGVAGAG